MSAPPVQVNSTSGLGGALSASAGAAQKSSNISLNTFLASIAAAAAIFGVELLLFAIIKDKLDRIYLPKTYLVPERQRTTAPPKGFLAWIAPVFKTSNSEFIQKSGLDAYFFLRFLRMLLKIFLPTALLVLPILLPINLTGSKGEVSVVKGLDLAAMANIGPAHSDRLWAHLVCAIIVITWVCYVSYDEMRGYIRLRQAYLTSPQHRLRASATTVLVSSIPRKWLSVEALEGLYDVFPGGIRNIWINRDFDELAEKVSMRNKWARTLEAAETDLIKKCKKAQLKKVKKEQKEAGLTKAEKKERNKKSDDENMAFANTAGVSSGDPFADDHAQDQAENTDLTRTESRFGMGKIGRTFGNIGHGVTGGVRDVGHGFKNTLQKTRSEIDERINPSTGFVSAAGEDDRGRSTDHHVTIASTSNAANEVATRSRSNTVGSNNSRPTTAAGSKPVTGLRPPGATADATIAEQKAEGTLGLRGGEAGNYTEEPEEPSTQQSAEATEAQKDIARLVLRGGDAEAEKSGWKFWQKRDSAHAQFHSPAPHLRVTDEDDHDLEPERTITNGTITTNGTSGTDSKKKKKAPPKEYPPAYDEGLGDDEGEPEWKKWISEKDRDTMRLPIFNKSWMFSIPLIGKKVDTIYWCRKELARLNLEIEEDQQEPEKYKLMNSAFIQFNHQVAAHMACQSVSHHIPQYMSPRVVEVSPEDVIWSNMRIRWWERMLRTAVVVALVIGLVIGWAFPVAFTGLISQLKYLTTTFKWLRWLNSLPGAIQGLIQGVLPPALLAALMALLPIILRLFATQQGAHTGMSAEISVQTYYFVFLFVQIFLVISISSTIVQTIGEVIKNPASAATLLATNLPKAPNFYFSYMILQAFSVSGGALVQIGALVGRFIMSPLFDSTAREKWKRQTTLSEIKWGTFYPVYTNLACIGLVFCVVTPIIVIFSIITFSLFWLVYRYNTLYVTQFKLDTGGLLFPRAINQLFTGIYVMEICLIGLFFAQRNANNKVASIPQAVIMIVVTIITVLFQILLNNSFSALFRYLPITLEDDAVKRDEAFAASLAKRHDPNSNIAEEEKDGDNLQDVLEAREDAEEEENRRLEAQDEKEIAARRTGKFGLDPRKLMPGKGTWARESQERRRSASAVPSASPANDNERLLRLRQRFRKSHYDVEGQEVTGPDSGKAETQLFAGMSDEIEDLDAEDRDALVQRAFQHEALRARRPVIWVPRDDLGVSDDEIYRTKRLSKHIWISNEYCGLDHKARCIFSRSPPDFSAIDIIQL